ncbi:WD40-repeat-containing domain protein [Fomitopsis serialis]|uniref:WD40-repeat-containing domain protein n=1 Tax=Fomitopsis serialis TaxID=139415 RepID=UPI002008E602|nr:WD40-repeat-containing domain protein [Neoantrodia serialis]KAH9920333.1 WD40-repeat-containing domain protein [Neoantrodia serialis]
MAKHPRKKQRTTKSAVDAPDPVNVRPLGSAVSLLDDSSKDDEERRLESLLFGTAYTPSSSKGEELLIISDDEDQDVDQRGEKELQNMLDTDLFFVDDPVGQQPELDVQPEPQASGSDGEDDAEARTDDEDAAQSAGAGPSEEDEERSEGEEESEEEALTAPKKKGPAWTDPDDPALQVSLVADKRRRKLRDAASEDMVGGREYERRLRRQFEKINPTPDWAASARKKLHPTKAKRRRPSTSSTSESDEEEGLPDVLADARGVLQQGRKANVIPQGILSIERLRDANLAAKSEGEVKAINGHTNPHLQTVHIPDLPVTTAMFHPGGTSILLTGPRPYYYTYDLMSGTALRSPRGLWGTTFANNNVAAQDGSMEICAFEPSGEVLAVAGRGGQIHLVDWRAGQGQVVGSVKMNAAVKSVWWASDGSGQMMSLGEDSERRCVKRWKDDGGFGSRLMVETRRGGTLRLGLVNVYGSEGVSALGSNSPKPLKTLGNLTTAITSLRFNHNSQLLAIASNTKKDQMRMVCIVEYLLNPSAHLTAFSNWPTSSTPLGHVTSIDFSARSEYVAIGNNRGRVLLYQLKDFGAQ